MKRTITVLAVLGIAATAATSAWAWTQISDPNNTLWPIRKVDNVRQLTYDIPDTESKLRSTCFIGVNPLTTSPEWGPQGEPWVSNKASVTTAAHLVCQDEPDLAFTKIEWDLTVMRAREGTFATPVAQAGDERTFGTPKTYSKGVATLAQLSIPCRDIAPGKAGTPNRAWVNFELRLWDTEGRDWYKSASDYDTIICPRKP